jgi:hypothetical protein
MKEPKSLTNSERCARSLLAAWNTGDLVALESAVRESAGIGGGECSAGEEERMEIVHEIASNIQMWLRGVRSTKPADLNTNLELLRHLARNEGAGEEAASGDEVFAGRVAAREVPRLEMLVSVLH